MNKAINYITVISFVGLEWLKFHDVLKPEVPTAADWLTLALSVLAIFIAAKSLLDSASDAGVCSP